MPFFSVIIPVFNRSALIRPTLDSIFRQTFTDYEIIAVDDGSSDDSLQVLRSYGERVRAFTQPNAGPGAARNFGLREACGEYVAFLDSDDLWPPWTLELFAREIRERCCGFVAGRLHSITADADASVALAPPPSEATVHSRDFFSSSQNELVDFCTGAVAIRTDALRAIGGYRPERLNYEDMDLYYRLGTLAGFSWIPSPPVLLRRLHDGNIFGNHEANFRGALAMIDGEQIGRFPGGLVYRRRRRQRLCALIRQASLNFLKAGKARDGMTLYSRTFAWNAALLRIRYLAAFPILAAGNCLTRSPA